MVPTECAMIMTRRVTLAVLLLFMLGAVLVASVRAAEPESTDPMVLATQYAKQATELRAGADKHRATAKLHKGGTGKDKAQHEAIARHCEKIAKDLEDAALESDALAHTYHGLALDR